mmetsp:Transcript_69467/g.166515  ORF Transcript_69467/g.166515 Transcript_69467/m.166515 type:complete len:203 (-) Transcript_69467:471-1079(-)
MELELRCRVFWLPPDRWNLGPASGLDANLRITSYPTAPPWRRCLCLAQWFGCSEDKGISIWWPIQDATFVIHLSVLTTTLPGCQPTRPQWRLTRLFHPASVSTLEAHNGKFHEASFAERAQGALEGLRRELDGVVSSLLRAHAEHLILPLRPCRGRFDRAIWDEVVFGILVLTDVRHECLGLASVIPYTAAPLSPRPKHICL